MNKITATGQEVIQFYIGSDGRPASGPCNVLVSKNQQNKLNHIMFLSVGDNSPTIVFVLSDSITIEELNSYSPAYPDPLNLQPILVTAIDDVSGSITADLDTIVQLIGGLADSIQIYTLTSQGNLSKIAICDASNQGTINLLISVDGIVSESEWRIYNLSSIKVDSISV